MEFLRHAGAADHAAPLQNAHAQARHAEIGRTGQPVVTGADDDGIEIGHDMNFGLNCRPISGIWRFQSTLAR